MKNMAFFIPSSSFPRNSSSKDSNSPKIFGNIFVINSLQQSNTFSAVFASQNSFSSSIGRLSVFQPIIFNVFRNKHTKRTTSLYHSGFKCLAISNKNFAKILLQFVGSSFFLLFLSFDTGGRPFVLFSISSRFDKIFLKSSSFSKKSFGKFFRLLFSLVLFTGVSSSAVWKRV